MPPFRADHWVETLRDAVLLLVYASGLVSVSVRLFVPWHEERYEGPRDTTPGLCRCFCCLPARHVALAPMEPPVGAAGHR
jgi:hypothetical protein